MEKLQFTYYSYSEIHVSDILENIDADTKGLFITEYKGSLYWIASKGEFYLVNDGWNTSSTTDFSHAERMLEKVILENN